MRLMVWPSTEIASGIMGTFEMLESECVCALCFGRVVMIGDLGSDCYPHEKGRVSIIATSLSGVWLPCIFWDPQGK